MDENRQSLETKDENWNWPRKAQWRGDTGRGKMKNIISESRVRNENRKKLIAAKEILRNMKGKQSGYAQIFPLNIRKSVGDGKPVLHRERNYFGCP